MHRSSVLAVLSSALLLFACSHDFGFLDDASRDASAQGDGSGGSSDGAASADANGDASHDANAGADAGAIGDASAVDGGGLDAAPPSDASIDQIAPKDAAPDSSAVDGGFLVCGGKKVRGCNPITNDGCTATTHCVWQSAGLFECAADNGNKVFPASCSDFTECAAGYDCFPTGGGSQCVKYCCASSDCASNVCMPFDQVGTCQ